jgi:hypothetical protein
MEVDQQNPEKKLLNPKKEEQYDRERISNNSAQHHRHGHSELKRMLSGYKRSRIKQIIQMALIGDNLEELSIPLLKSVLIPFKVTNSKHEAQTLRTIVENKLERREETHAAWKRRHGISFTPRSKPKSQNLPKDE